MENLWSIIKRCVEKRKAANLEKSNRFLHEEWVNTDVVVILNHSIDSMKSRCLEIIVKCNTFVP